MDRTNLTATLFISLILAFIFSCEQSNEQKEFEREAINLPENITETIENGTVVEGKTDPDDWRVAPFFQGVASIDQPPFPNPLLTNQQLNIEILISGFEGVSGLQIFVLYNGNSFKPLFNDLRSPLPPGLISIRLNALDIPQFSTEPAGLYRIILEDLEGNIISYGDIKIE